MSQPRLNIVLYQPEIPQNTGNIGRTCVAVGAKLWIVRPTGFRLDNHHLRRSGLDYWEHLQWQTLADATALEAEWDLPRTYFFTKRAHCNYTEVAFRPGDFFVFGSETNGLPDRLTSAHESQCVRIPMEPQVRSLNLSNAVAVAAFEAIRQWNSRP